MEQGFLNSTRILEAIPDGIFSLKYSVFENEAEIGRIEMKPISLRYRTKIVVHGKTYVAMRVGSFPAKYALLNETEDTTLATCSRKGIFKQDFIAESYDHSLVVHPKLFSAKETHELIENDIKIGHCAMAKLFSRRLIMETQTSLSLEFRVFILWFVLVQIAVHNSSSAST